MNNLLVFKKYLSPDCYDPKYFSMVLIQNIPWRSPFSVIAYSSISDKLPFICLFFSYKKRTSWKPVHLSI